MKILSIMVLLAAVLLIAGCAEVPQTETPQQLEPVVEVPSEPVVHPPITEPPTETTAPTEAPTPAKVTGTTETTTPVLIAKDSGRVIFTITDAAADMGSVSSIVITIDNASAHKSGGGWFEIMSEQKSYNLLQLNADGTQALLGEAGLEQGIYYEVRLGISKVVVTDANGAQEAKLPSGVLKVGGRLAVSINETSTVAFDFIANESLHTTGKGEYILSPVVKLETRSSADVDASSAGDVKIKDGRVDTNSKVGMNENGFVGVGIKIRPETKLTIENGKIKKT